MIRAHTTDRAAVAELRTAVGGGLRYALIGSGVIATLVTVKLGVLTQDALPRWDREFEAPALERLPSIAGAPSELYLRHTGGSVVGPRRVALAHHRGQR